LRESETIVAIRNHWGNQKPLGVSDCLNGFWLPQWFLISPMVYDCPNGFWLPQWFLISPMVSDCLNDFWLPQSFLPRHYDQRMSKKNIHLLAARTDSPPP
jgi:hypothetical protein